MIAEIEKIRRQLSKDADAAKQAELGQFLTPASTAGFMAAMFPKPGREPVSLLDAGAGIGSLSAAFLERHEGAQVRVSAFEIDATLHDRLRRCLAGYRPRGLQGLEINGGDFIAEAVRRIEHGEREFTHAILNPPYRKIGSASEHRTLLRRVGIETGNLYSAFVALAILLMKQGGQIVAIIPRSFCNGTYYRPFREFLFQHAAIRQIHLFGARDKAFRDDSVLQENVIVRLECGAQQGPVTISTSADDRFENLTTREFAFDRIVMPSDREGYIHVPSTEEDTKPSDVGEPHYALAQIGVNVSTGPVVDFRLKAYLREEDLTGTVPLLYPAHFRKGEVRWPLIGSRKPNAIDRNEATEKWLFPGGYYCVVRRFSSKEEKRRIVASVVAPQATRGAEALGFENHLNVFHEKKHGLPEALARGLALYLNSTAVDERFRRFSGHTQVNATDLKGMDFPSRWHLMEMGKWAKNHADATQPMIDRVAEGKFDEQR